MKNRDFMKGVATAFAIATAASFLYPIVIAAIAIRSFVHGNEIHGWLLWSAIPSVYVSWFLSWVAGTIWESAES